MQTFLHLLKELFKRAIHACYPELEIDEAVLEVSLCTQAEFGHYQCNSAMRLAKLLRKNPRAVAEELVAQVKALAVADDLQFTSIQVAGAGFINVTFTPETLAAACSTMLREPKLGVAAPQPPLHIIVEFSSPNVAKEMHVGHLRSTIIGECIARLFEFLGHQVLRLNHVGDWGTQFGMLIAYIKEVAPGVFQGAQTATLSDLMIWYRASKQRFDADEAFKKQAQSEVVALQGGNPENRQAWEKICAISRAAFDEIYALLNVRLIERGESTYNSLLPALVADLEKRGVATLSEGAKCIFIEGLEIPFMVQKSDGGYNYDTTDLAALRQRVSEERADRIIYVVDAGQSLHFQLLFKSAEKAGYCNPQKVRLDHVSFGLVLGPDGKKFRTRSGETEKLIDLLKTGISEAKRILQERDPLLQGDELESLARALGLNAIKYADLACQRTHDYAFSYERMLRFEGNTAAFLMYAYVRILGIKRKVAKEVETLISTQNLHLQHPSEIALALHALRFKEALEMLSDDLLPHRFTEYLYDLAVKFHAFFRDCRVEGDPREESRLLLCELVGRILKQGMEILGLTPVQKM